MTPQIILTAARNTGTPVTLRLTGGRQFSGVVRRSALLDTFYVDTPGTTRTTFFRPDEILEVTLA